ncbi:MAG TPA: DEAD/DEAH box helicase [Anaerolineales bacterium]|nr:DEAD/DEAH box helicase [Anaerolineales bacterium]
MSFESLIAHWQADPLTAPNLAVWRSLPEQPAKIDPLPDDLPAALKLALARAGIRSLYSHQARAWQVAASGSNLVLATGTASGKTLAYNLPVLSALLESETPRALYLFPTKALAQDQLSLLRAWISLPGDASAPVSSLAAIYDGDTPQGQRPSIRRNARLIITNPDMLHAGILPHHTNWDEFFRGLHFVVIDEMHAYRGVFGSHVANVIRRLKRVAAFHGARLQFILSSATIGNPRELAERLIESPVELIDQDGSARGPRQFLLYNPPVVNQALGLRKSSMQESVRLAQDLHAHRLQTVLFARSRRSVELMLSYLQAGVTASSGVPRATDPGSGSRRPATGSIRGYRSGYLASERREIESGLRDGSVKTVVATNALELGIDIGGLGAAVLAGYPGSIASVYQQAGRAGRGAAPALAVLVASANPLDQFLAHHPEYFLGQSPEQALINPDHLLILLSHLRCAMFELPFQRGESFGALPAERLQEFLDFLVSSSEAHASQDRYFWMSDAYPAANISLRSASAENVVLQAAGEERPLAVGEVDLASALWMVHPRAVYLHEGQQYFVQELDLIKRTATLVPVGLDYYTEPQQEIDITLTNESAQEEVPGGQKGWGELQVTTRVVGFKKLRWQTQENLGTEPLDLPPTELQTTGYWLSLSDPTLEALRLSGAWTNDPNDYGPDWARISLAVRTRDAFRCQVCGAAEAGREHDVHHKIPFRAFASASVANRLDNLVTLCRADHRRAEQNVRIRSGLAGVAYLLGQLAPLFLMCDPGDLGVHTDAAGAVRGGPPSVVLYDQVPAGIGFSQRLFELHAGLMSRASELVHQCPCQDGCPSCVGPGGENGLGGKAASLAILDTLTK